MKEKIYAALFALFLFGTANASTILWNVFEHSNFHGYESFHYYGEQTPEISHYTKHTALQGHPLMESLCSCRMFLFLFSIAQSDDLELSKKT